MEIDEEIYDDSPRSLPRIWRIFSVFGATVGVASFFSEWHSWTHLFEQLIALYQKVVYFPFFNLPIHDRWKDYMFFGFLVYRAGWISFFNPLESFPLSSILKAIKESLDVDITEFGNRIIRFFMFLFLSFMVVNVWPFIIMWTYAYLWVDASKGKSEQLKDPNHLAMVMGLKLFYRLLFRILTLFILFLLANYVTSIRL